MKYIVVLGDGMADEPLTQLGGKTPLMVANKPSIDSLCKRGRTGLLQTVPAGMLPGSEVANLSVLGYDVPRIFQGRGVLEAASMGVGIEPNELVMRCNLICVEQGRIKNHSAGHITSEEAGELIHYLDHHMGNGELSFYSGVSYRHILKLKGGHKQVLCAPPHDKLDVPFEDVLVQAKSAEAQTTATRLNELILRSQQLLKDHPVNLKRRKAGKDPANSIWPWSPGYKPAMETFSEMFGKTGAVISAVDLIQGIGKLAQMEVIKVEGATGLYNTNYEGKAQAAIEALNRVDFVFLHVEASDEAGHEGDVDLKIKTIEYLDHRVVKYLVEEASGMDEDVTIAVLPDHPTPCAIRTHTSDPVPFLIANPLVAADAVVEYNEVTVKDGSYGLVENGAFMRALFAGS